MFNDLFFCKGIWFNYEILVVLKIMKLIFYILKLVYFVIEMFMWVKYIRLKYFKGLNKLFLNYYIYGWWMYMILFSVVYRYMIYGYKFKFFEIKNEIN